MKGKRPTPNVFCKASLFIKRSSPTILTCIGAVGVVATAVLAVRATPKAETLIRRESRKNHDGDPYAGTKTEAVKACWHCYVPAAATGAATIVCIFGANVLNRRQQASLASAYALASRSFHDYKGKVKELYGEEAHRKIMESLAAEKVDPDHIITACNFTGSSCLDFEDANEEEMLFYEAFSGRYFQSTISKVLQAEYHLNRNFALSGGCSLNSFYEFLGIDTTKEGDDIGWVVDDELYWIEFDHSKAVLEDGLECYIIDMPWAPQPSEYL